MAAKETFLSVLHGIQMSNLNYKIEISPFSATIYLKNSFFTDKNGNPVHNPFVGPTKPETDVFNNRILHLENTIQSLQENYASAVHESERVCQTNHSLESTVQLLHSKLSAAEQRNFELQKQLLSNRDANDNTAKGATSHLEADLKKEKQEVADLGMHNDTLNKIVTTLRNELKESKARAKSEMVEMKKVLKAEVKSWRKDLGEERKSNIKLEKKLLELTNKVQKESELTFSNICTSSTSTFQANSFEPSEAELSCTICAEPISDYIPKFFMGTEMNPACNRCQDSSSESDQDHETEKPFT